MSLALRLASCTALLAACAAEFDYNQLAESHDVVSRSTSDFEPNVPEECLSAGICEDLPDYPEDQVAQIIKDLGAAKDSYYAAVAQLREPATAQRFDINPQGTELCASKQTILVPKAATDEDGKWYFILNQRDKPFQGYRVDVCSLSTGKGHRLLIISEKHIARDESYANEVTGKS